MMLLPSLSFRSRAAGDRRAERGNVLIAALVVVMLVFGLCMGFVRMSSGITARQARSVDMKQARNLAEVGLAEAYFGLTAAKTGNIGAPESPAAIGDGILWVEATELGDNQVQLASTALHGRGRITLGLVVQRKPLNLSSLGIFSSKDFRINPNTLMDSYDSSQGTYGEHLAWRKNEQTVVGSNYSVSVASGSSVLGDVHYGPTGSLSVAAGAVVTGKKQQSPAPTPLPPVEVPDTPLAPSLTVGAADVTVIPPGEHGYLSLKVKGKAVLTGPMTAVFGALSVENNATLSFDNSKGPIDIYVTGDLSLDAGSVAATVSDDPNMLSIQISSDENKSCVLGARSLFYGQIYAPQAQVKVLPNFEVFGSLVAGEIVISAQSRMHYDRNTMPTRQGVLPQLWSWRVLDLPDAIAGMGGDPFQLMGLDRRELLPPAAAHQDQFLEVTYLDADGILRTYAGWESDFDWTQASLLLIGKRDGEIFYTLPAKESAERVEPEYTAEEQALVDFIQSPASSAEVHDKLLAEFPVSDSVLIEAIKRVPSMDVSDLYDLLYQYGPKTTSYPKGKGAGPLSDGVLMAALFQPDFTSKSMAWTLIQNAPISEAVLQATINRNPPLSNADLSSVLKWAQ
jgi:hypothetical protein